MTNDQKITDDERRVRMLERNAAICAYYQAGHKLADVSSHFRLGRQRVRQILEEGGVWQPYAKKQRTKFLGVNVTEETKAALKQEAERQGVSVSKLSSDMLDEAVGAKNGEVA